MKEFYFSIVIPTYNDSSGFIDQQLKHVFHSIKRITYQCLSDKIFQLKRKLIVIVHLDLNFMEGVKDYQLQKTGNWPQINVKVMYYFIDDGLLFNASSDQT